MPTRTLLREIIALLDKPKSRGEMAGELLREIAVLLLVFAPLDWLFNPAVVRWWEIAAIVCLATMLGYLGIRIEEGR